MQFLKVNFTILSEEFNKMADKLKETQQFKVEYEKNKTEWSRKVEASAGDVRDHLTKIENLNQI